MHVIHVYVYRPLLCGAHAELPLDLHAELLAGRDKGGPSKGGLLNNR